MNFERSLSNIVRKLITGTGGNEGMFYGMFLATLNKSFSDDLSTACVSKHPSADAIELILGKHWWEVTCYTDERKMWTLCHELEHVIREHLIEMAEGRFPDKTLANIAMDMSINQNLPFERADPDEKGISKLVFFENFADLKMEPFQSSQYYYLRLRDAKEKKQMSKGKTDSKNPNLPKNNKRGSSGSAEFDKWLDAEEDGKLEDWHALWKNLTKGMSEAERKLFREEIQESIRRTAEEIEKSKGTVPQRIKDAIAENFGKKPPVVSWKTLFNRFVGSSLSTLISTTRKRPNFRFEEAPVNKYKNRINVVVGMDSSGSVSDTELQEFFAQTNHMWKAGAKIHICIWDSHVHYEYEYKGENTYKRLCQGGTHASSFIEYVNENRKKNNWTCAVTLTDGLIEQKPVECDIPMLWVITKDGSIEFEHSCKKIKMT